MHMTCRLRQAAVEFTEAQRQNSLRDERLTAGWLHDLSPSDASLVTLTGVVITSGLQG